MNLNQPTLIEFENERRKNNIVPPEGSNSFYNIGNGSINLLTKRSDPENYRFDLFTNSGSVNTGNGDFVISGDIKDIENPYNDLTVIPNTSLTVNNQLTVSSGSLFVHGNLNLLNNSKLFIRNNGHVIFYSDSDFVISEKSQILVEKGSTVTIYGRIDIHLAQVNSLLNVDGVTIDSACVLNVTGIDFKNRSYSLTDYNTELMNKKMGKHTQGEKNYNEGRIGFTWKDGNPLQSYQVFTMSTMTGDAILGDFRLPVLGIPENEIPNKQVIDTLHICEDTTLYITESFNNSIYIRPELYLGIIIGNNKIPANCIIDGTIIADGQNSLISIDRGATMHIEETGELHLKNNAILRSTYNEDKPVLFINGTLVIETIEQIDTFNKDNIVFGENGKLIILNPDTGERVLLFTTPNGIEDTKLYKIFKDDLDHIEYHITNNHGIGIDQYYEFYSQQFTNWYANRRIEQAIFDKLLVWHDGGFIELYNSVIPWVDTNCTLLHASRIFKTYGSYDEDKLQDAVERLKYAGCGDILFRFIKDGQVGEVTMSLSDIHVESIVNHPMTEKYVLTADNDGELFIKNKVNKIDSDEIISSKSHNYEIKDKKVDFSLE